MPSIKRDKLKPFGKQPVPAGGRIKQMNSKTPLLRTAGMVRLICPICFIDFQKPYAWVKRCENNYCGRGCANEAKKVRIEKACMICGKIMSLTPTLFKRCVTCSRECKSAKTRIHGNPYRSSYAYQEALDEIVKTNKCQSCGRTHGPWTIRNLKVHTDGIGLKADSSKAFLLCRHCALLETAEKGRESNPNHIKHRNKSGELYTKLP